MSLPAVSQRYTYEVIDSLFEIPPEGIDADKLPLPRFGLGPNVSSWTALTERVEELQAKAAPGELVKLVFLARHGAMIVFQSASDHQGTHNLAAEKYGRQAFYSKLASQQTDGQGLVWGPDPPLTELGEQQARRVNAAWKSEGADGMPSLQSLYVSPLRRAGKTLELSVGDVVPDVQPVVLEDLREGVNVWHERAHNLPVPAEIDVPANVSVVFTDNERSARSEIEQLFPRFAFEAGFPEADPMWTRSFFETGEAHIQRTRDVFDRIFAHDPNTYIGIYAHGGTQLCTLALLGRKPYVPAICAVLPFVLRATPVHEGTATRGTAVVSSSL